ncbi:MAG: hypothetical protein J6X78_04725 [Treponema sp.]|nr:hypothetical protein [Treponema sp.]
MSKTSVKASLLKIRRLVLAFGLFFIVQAGWGETYYWIGCGTDNNWTTVENWSTSEGGAAGTGYPGDTDLVTNDEVHIYGTVEVSIDDDISIGKLLIEAGNAHFLDSSFTTTLSGTGSLTITETDTGAAAINLTRCSSTDGVIGTLTINLPVTCKGTIQTHSGTTLNIASGKNLETVNLVHSAYGASPKTELQVNGTLTVSDTLNLNAMGSGATQLIVFSGGLVDAKNITFGSATYSNTGAASAIVNNGTIKVSNAFTIPDLSLSPYTGSGTIQLDGNGTGASFTNNYTSDNITIIELQGLQTATVSGGGHTSISTATFSAGATISDASITTAEFTGAADISGSTITTATFHNDITLSGANTFTSVTATGLGGKTLTVNAEQTIQSGGSVTLSGTDSSNLLEVKGSGKFTLGTAILTGEYLSLDTDSSVVSASTGTIFAQNSGTTGSGTTNWIVTSAGGHLWNGENGDWETAANWIPQTTPDTDDEVIINGGTPKINSTITVKSISVNAGGVNLSSGSLSLEAITLATDTSVSTEASTSITITEDWTLDEKITGAGKLILASGKNYTIVSGATIDINLENNGTLSSIGAVIFKKDYTNKGITSFSGGLTLAGNFTDSGTAFSGNITLNGNGVQTLTPQSGVYEKISVDKASGTLFVSGDLEVKTLLLTDGVVSFEGNLTLWDGANLQDFDFTTLLDTITFTGGNSTIPNVLRAKDITSSQKIQAGYLQIDATNITLNDCKNISNPILHASGNINVNGIEAQSLSIAANASSVNMNGTIKLTDADSDFVIDYPLVLTGTTTFDVAADIIIRNSTSYTKVGSINSDSTARELTLTAGNGGAIRIQNGTSSGAGLGTGSSLSKITFNSDLVLSSNTVFDSAQTNFAGTSAKTVTGAYTLSVKGNITDNGIWTWDSGSLLLFDGTTNQTFKTNTNSTFNDVTVNKTAGNFIIDTSVFNVQNLTITNCAVTQFTGVNQITSTGNLSFTKEVTSNNDLTISATSGTVSFGNTFVSTGDLSVTANTLTFGGNVSVKNFVIDATTTTSSNITVSGNWANNKATAGFTANGGTVKLTPAAASVTIRGNNTFNNLTAGDGTAGLGGKTITFEAGKTQTINGILTLSGTSDSSLLTLENEGSGIWYINCSNPTINYVDVINSTSTNNIFAIHSKDSGSNIKWTFPGMEYKWNGTTDNSWATATNWEPESVPGKGALVEIRSGKTNYPIISSTIDLYYDDDNKGSITNNGTITFYTNGSITADTKANGPGSTIIYDATMTSVWGDKYENLEITNGKTVTFASDTEIKGNLTSLGNTDGSGYLIFNGTSDQTFSAGTGTYSNIRETKTQNKLTTSGNCTITNFAIAQSTETIFENNLTITNLSITAGGQTKFSGQPTLESITDAAGAGAITFADSATIKSDVTFNTTGTVSFANNTNVLTAGSPDTYHSITHTAGTTEIKGTLTAADVILYKADLKGTTNIIAHGNVTFENTPSGSDFNYANVSNNQDLTITTIGDETSTTFNGDVGKTTKLKSLTINGKTNIKCTSIATTGNQTYNGDVILHSNSSKNFVTLTTNASAKIDFSGNITKGVSKAITFTIDSPILKNTASVADPSNPPTVTVECDELAFSKDNTEIASAGASIQFTVPKISGTGKTVTLTNSVGELSFNGDVEFNPNITTTASSHFKASSGEMTFKADVNFANGTLAANNGTIILTAENKTPAGTAATLNGNNTFKTLTLQGPVILSGANTIIDLNIQNSVTISEGNTITNFAANKTGGLGGKTIKFGAGTEQTVSGVLTLKGSDNTDGNRLNLRSLSDTGSQWKIKCTGANSHDIEFVDVQDGWNTSETGTPTPVAYNLFAITSNDSGNNTNWNFPSMIYTWNGSLNNSWNNASNWTPSSIPGKGADVRIDAVTSPASTLLLGSALDLTSTYDGTDYNGIITVNAGAVFDLAGNNLTVGKITNKGLVRLTGTSTQTIQATMENNGFDSAVEYYGNGEANSNFAWDGDNGAGTTGKQYVNLILSRAISQNTGEANKLDVPGTIAIIAGSINSVSLNNEHNFFGGHVILGNQSPSTSAGTVTLNGTGTAGDAIFLMENVIAENLTLNSNVQGENLSINSPLTLNAATVTTTGTQTYNNTVTLGTTNAHTLSGTQITFENNATINGAAGLTLSGTTNNILNADVGGSTALASLTVNGPVRINCAQIKTTGNQTYNGTVTLIKTGNITLFAKNASDVYQTVFFKYNVNCPDTSSVTNLIIDAKTQIECSVVSTTGEQTYNGDVSIQTPTQFTGTTLTFGNNLSGSDAANLKTLTFKDCGTVDISAATAVVSNLNLIFDGATATETTTVTTTFNPGTTTYKNITNKNITLDFATNSFAQNNSSNFIIESGKVKAGTGGFTGGNLIVSGGTFEQTGAADDSVNDLTISGTGTITWDNGNDEGTLEIKGTVSEQDGKTISYNKKSVTFQNTNTITGVFWDLVIPNGKIITNGGTIRIRRNFTIEGTYDHNDKTTILGLDTDDPDTNDTVNGTVTNNVANASNASNLGKVIINKGTTNPATTLTAGSNLLFTDVNIQSGTFVSDKTLSVQNFEIETNGTFTNTSNVSNGIVNISQNFTDNGTYSSSGTGKLVFNGTANQTFTAKNNSTYSAVEENKNTGTLGITGNPSITTFTLTKGTTTTFSGTPIITNFNDTASAGNIEFNAAGSITATGGVTFATTGNVKFTSASPAEMNITGPLIHTAGATNITGTLNASSVNLGASGKTITLAGAVNTTGSQSYNGPVTLGSQTELNSTTAGQVAFGNYATIDGGYPLEISAQATGTTFNAIIGNTAPPSSISITGPLNINCSSIKTTGNQTYDGTVRLSKSSTLMARNASGEYQTVQFDGDIDNLDSATQNLIVDAKTSINCDTIAVNSVTFNQPVTLLKNTTITTDVNDTTAKLVFEKSLFGGTAPGHSLTTVDGSVEFKDTVSGISTLTTAATATFNGNVNIGELHTQTARINCASITTSENQTYDGAVTLLKSGEIKLTAKNSSNEYQTVQFNGNVVKSGAGTYSLVVDSKTNINCDAISVNSATFKQDVTLLHDTTITTDSADTAKLVFEKTLSGGTTPGHSLTTLAGSVVFGDTITGLSSLATVATASFNGNVSAGSLQTQVAKINCASITTTGNQTYNGAITLFKEGNITLTAKDSDVVKIIRFNANIGQSDSGTENLIVDGNTRLYCSDINVNNVDFKQPVTLYHNVKITADSGNTIHFEKPLAGAYAFETVTGSAQFDDTITDLTSLKTDATATFDGNVSVATIDARTANINCDEVTTTGSQIYRGPVVSNAKEITSANSTITFEDELEIQETTQLTATNAIFEKAVTINGDTTITTEAATSATIRFDEVITGDHSLETQTGSVSFAKSITGLTALTTDASAVFADTVNVDTLHTQTARFNGNVTADSIVTHGAIRIYCDTITTTGNQTYNNTVTIYNPAELSSGDTISFYNSFTLLADTTLTADSNDSKINYKSTITDGGTGIRKILTIDSPVFNSTAVSGNSVTITLGTLRFAQDETSLKSTNNTTVNLNAAKIDGVGKTVVVDSSLANFAMTHASVVVEPNIKTESGSNFTAASGTTTFNSDVDFANGTLDAHGGEIKLTAENKTSANPPVAVLNGNNTYKHLTFSGGVTMTGNNVIEGALLLTGTAPVRIEGSNTITNLTAGNNTTGLGGKTITFGAGKTQTVEGKLQLIGTTNLENNRLVLRSSVEGSDWTINCTGANTHSIQYVDIQDSNNASSYNLFALSSNDSGNNVNWNFPGMQYTWVGGRSSNPEDWNTKENWSPASIPNKGAVVSIPADKSSYPVLTVPLNLNDRYDSRDYNGTITVAANAIFDLADENLTVGTITNNGLVRLNGAVNGAEGQTIHGTMINGTDSTVEYYPDAGTTTITNFAWDGEGTTPQEGKQYEKLHVNAQVIISDKITVNKTTAITAGTGKSVTLNNAGNVFIGNIMLGNSSAATPATSINAGAVTLNSSGTITLDDNAYADSFVCNCPVKLKNITTIGNQTYNGLVSLLDSATFKTTGDSALITLNASLKGDGSSDKSLTIDSALKLITNCSYINNLDAVTFKKPVEILSNTKITTATGEKILFKDEITGTGSLETITGSVVFEKTITNLASLKTAATATFNDDVDIGILNTQKAKINCDSITANIATFGDSVILLSDTQITTDAAATDTDTANLIFKKDVYGSGNYSLETIDGSVIFDDVINDITSLTTDATATFNGNLTAETLHTQIAKINCAEIITTGNQTYDGTVTLFKAGDIKLTAKNGSEYNTVQFNANVNNSTAGIENLIVDAKTNINCAAITVNNATFNQPVTLLHDTTITTDSADEAKLIFKKSLSGGDAPGHSLTTATGSVEFEDTITRLSSLTTAATATFNGNVSAGTITTLRANINCSSITTNSTTNADQTYNGAVEILTDTTLSISSGSSGTITFTSAVNGNNKLSFEAGPNNIIFNNKVGKSETATQSESPLKELKISTAANTTFNDIVCIGTFTDTASSGNIFFKKSGKINTVNQQTFNTTGNVVFGDTNNDNAEMLLGSNITHVAGTTKLYGKLTAPELDITLGNSEITGTITAENITLGQTENATITGGPMTITNTGLFKTVDGASLNFTTSFTQNGTGNSVIGGTFTGNGPATFATDVMIYGTTAANFGTSGQTITIGAGSSAADKNLIISRTAPAAAPLTINAATVLAKNIVLYKGAVILNGNMTANQDMIILGADYSTTDSDTGIPDEYSYYCDRPSTWSQPNYNEARLPDGTTAPGMTATTGDFTATLSTSADKTVTVKKNFYANGTALSTNGTSGQWILKLPDITNAANGFAEAYHSSISGCNVVCSNGSTDGTKARLVTLECTDAASNTNVDFDDFQITAAWTERDNSIRVEFNRPVRYHSATVEALKFLNAADSPVLDFAASSTEFDLYSDPDCQQPISYDTQLSYFYLKATPQNGSEYGSWNTDATGKTSGEAQSTDRSGIHHQTKPAFDFPRALSSLPYIITDRWGKRLVNYSTRTPSTGVTYGSTNDTTNEVLDKTGPVLYSVRTGQELHNAYDSSVGEACEHSYDSHNFIEFVYSEKVDFNGTNNDASLNAPLTSPENIQVTDSLGAIMGDITKSENLRIAGLGTVQHGLIYTGSSGRTDKYVNALYRNGSNAEYSIKLSIAGYTNGTVTDTNNFTYKKWTGYIEQAEMPSGTVKHLVNNDKKNERVKDKAGNVQIKYENDSFGQSVYDTIPVVNSTESGLYGAWDISEPVFAIIRQNSNETAWSQLEFSKKYQAESIGNNSGVGSTLDRIEFHLYDNTPDFDGNSPEWFTEIGWCESGSEGIKPADLYKDYSYAADIFGGARPFDDAQRRTSGGIRYSTIHSAVNAFKYGIGTNLTDSLVKTSFDTTKIASGGASSLIFTGSSSLRRSAGELEGLYFSLPLEITTLDIKTSFTIKYDDKVGFITDLAGNRLRSKTFSTIDRTPPSIDMTVCPIGGDELEIIFVKELCIDSNNLGYYDNTTMLPVEITERFEELITQCIDFVTIDSSGVPVVSDLKVKRTVPATISISHNKNGSDFTSVRLKLERTVTLEDIKTVYVRITYTEKYGKESTDLFTGHPGSRVTFFQDVNKNSIQMYTAHALSDFAVGVINPLYAYDSAMTEDDGSIVTDSLLHKNLTDDVDIYGWSVHDWNRDQQNYGTLPAKRPVAIVADTSDGTLENENAPDSFRVYLANNPDALSVSTQYNNDLEPSTSWRIWLPDETSDVFTALSEKNNTKYSQVDGTLLSEDKSDRMIFELDESITNKWAAGNQISFLFGLTNNDGTPVTIMHSPELDINNDMQYLPSSVKMPLFALRQTDPEDLMSLDLWSFKLKTNISQRGGVTILNNVIDSAVGEKAVVKVDVLEDGTLTVLVMTLDGNIVDYLHRGSAKAGEHFYTWDGSNRKGNPVARGMYFIRVIGPGLDETRKVLVIKE